MFQYSKPNNLQYSRHNPLILQEKPIPNAIIVVGTVTIIGNAHLHHRQDSDGLTEEDGVGDNRVPKEIKRMLL